MIDKIIVFEPIQFINVRRNEVKDKVLLSSMKSKMNGKEEIRVFMLMHHEVSEQRMILKDVRYGVAFHFELTGLKMKKKMMQRKKHYNIIKRRLEKGQFFRVPCLGCSEFPVKKFYMVDQFPMHEIAQEILAMGDVDLGFMNYKVVFRDGGIPINKDWESPKFSDKADTVYYRPHMIGGIIDVAQYKGSVNADTGTFGIL